MQRSTASKAYVKGLSSPALEGGSQGKGQRHGQGHGQGQGQGHSQGWG